MNDYPIVFINLTILGIVRSKSRRTNIPNVRITALAMRVASLSAGIAGIRMRMLFLRARPLIAVSAMGMLCLSANEAAIFVKGKLRARL